ncbi:hypothetical protein [Streptomyces sp. NPDC046261]|uniref:hypothetical protein n=1 Tax=Streptomyces sp. NPDC046261 TaxID=3157200 RepID=UPI003402CC90
MKLAIGDVVRGRDALALGTVAGVTSTDTGRLVMVQLPDGGFHFSDPGSLIVVARRTAPTTTGRNVVALLAFGIALFAAFVGCRSARELGADWLLAFLSGLGGHTAVMAAYQWWLRLTGPRRFRV